MKNKDAAEALYRISELLVLKNENVFKVRAYERASEIVSSLPEPIENIAEKGALKDIPGIGASIAEKITEYLQKGKIAYLEELRSNFPAGLFEIMNLQGVGPKKAKLLYDKLKVKDIASLREAAEGSLIKDLVGFGKKSEENILKSIKLREKFAGRTLLAETILLSEEIITGLMLYKPVKRADAAGSLRRFRETIGDIDILCTAEKGAEEKAVEHFTKLPFFSRVISAGPTKASAITGSGMQVDLRVVDDSVYGSALVYFTGSKEHNINLRGLAKDKGFLVNEYGVFKAGRENKPVASKTEEDVYASLGLQFIPPELRENRGEIEAAGSRKLPHLVELSQIRGDTHAHSKYSDGSDSLELLAEKARARGYEWLAVTDHSQSLKIAGGLSIQDIKRKLGEIERLNSKMQGFKLLCGTEADILNDGSLDYPDEILKQLDFVIASIHSGFTQSGEQITRRVIRAIENPYVHCIGHLTGRLLNEREPYAINADSVIAAARAHNKFLELNAFPDRLDLNDVYCKKAKEAGVMIAIGTDSHSLAHFANMDIGVRTARRGWLEKNDVVNSRSYDALKKLLKN